MISGFYVTIFILLLILGFILFLNDLYSYGFGFAIVGALMAGFYGTILGEVSEEYYMTDRFKTARQERQAVDKFNRMQHFRSVSHVTITLYSGDSSTISMKGRSIVFSAEGY